MKAAPFNLKMYSLPLALLVWIGKKQYQAANIQSFFDENISQWIRRSRRPSTKTWWQEGLRLGVPCPP